MEELFDEVVSSLIVALSDFIDDKTSSISNSIVSSLDIFTGSPGSGSALKSGGKTNGYC